MQTSSIHSSFVHVDQTEKDEEIAIPFSQSRDVKSRQAVSSVFHLEIVYIAPTYPNSLHPHSHIMGS